MQLLRFIKNLINFLFLHPLLVLNLLPLRNILPIKVLNPILIPILFPVAPLAAHPIAAYGFVEGGELAVV